MKAGRLLRAVRESWGSKYPLAPTLMSIALLLVLGLGALRSSEWLLAPRAGADPGIYTVAPGDTVAGIAEKFGTTVDSIATANNLPSADEIFAGQDLQVDIPNPSSPGGGGAAESSYTVAEGDTLWDIASKHGVDLGALLERNSLPEGDLLQPGQQLTIPSANAIASAAPRGGDVANPGGRIWVPWRTQLDGSPAAGSNCGPATLGIAMSYFGEWWTTAGIRRSVNESQGTWGPDAGTTWEAMAYAARERGFRVVGLYNEAGGYRQWTIDDLVAQTKAGHPVILLTRYWSLPGHGESAWWGDHYIAFVGLNPAGDVIYHDAAFATEAEGAYRTMSKDRLIRAWTRTATGYQYTAMALEWPGQ